MKGDQLIGLAQPDRRTCGSATLVAARLINEPGYATYVLEGPAAPDVFRAEVLAMHRRTSRGVDEGGRWQLPWPRALGTSPWSLVRQLDQTCGVPGTTYVWRLVLAHQRGRAFDAVRAAVSAGHATALYVGNRLGPRHIVLAIDTSPLGVVIYDPGRGRRYPVTRDDYVRARLDVAGWQVPWLVVLPRRVRPPGPHNPV